MKKIQQIMLGMILFLSFTSCATPIKNAKKETFKVAGNCNMCKENIETAANRKGLVKADWNADSKVLELTYDSQKTNSDEILKRIAYAGYDNEKFLAPEETYAKLAGCCQYDRMKKSDSKTEQVKETHQHETVAQETIVQANVLDEVYANYFAIKDALVKDDGNTAAAKATALSKSISNVDMSKMSSEQHAVWMKVQKDLLLDAGHISETKETAHQRDHFVSLSKNMHEVVKTFKADATIYYQHCPMYNDGKGADWLSKENAVKNPYYGSAMLTCGKTIETIK